MFETQIMNEKIRYGHIDDKVVDWCLQLIVSLVEDRGNEYSFSEDEQDDVILGRQCFIFG